MENAQLILFEHGKGGESVPKNVETQLGANAKQLNGRCVCI
jgi:hypothetical protein